MLLIFLIPYALVTTGFVGWQIYQQSKRTFDPLERLPDPKPGDGGARRIHPHAPLPAELKASLGRSLRVGDLEVTPLSVERNAAGQLVLHLRLRNASHDTAFAPLLPAECYRCDKRARLEDAGPYTYLEVGGGKRLYVSGRDWDKAPPRAAGEPFDGTLLPGEEMTAAFRIGPADKAALWVAARGEGPLLWRVQLRRGLVALRDTEVSATAVVGVEFRPRAMAGEAGELARRRAAHMGERQSPHEAQFPAH
jgi:hypothetical protein